MKGPLLERSMVKHIHTKQRPLFLITNLGSQCPQNFAVHLTLLAANGAPRKKALVAWIGMTDVLYLEHLNSANKEKVFKTLEIDP